MLGQGLSSKGGADRPVSLQERLKQLLRRLRHRNTEDPAAPAAAAASTLSTDLQPSPRSVAEAACDPDCGWAAAESIAWLAQQARAAEALLPGSDDVLRLLESPALRVTAAALEQLVDRTACLEHESSYVLLTFALWQTAEFLETVHPAAALNTSKEVCERLQKFCNEGRSGKLLTALQRLPHVPALATPPAECSATGSHVQDSGSGGCRVCGRWDLMKPRLPARVFMHGDGLVPRIAEALQTTRNVGIIGVPGCGATTIAAAVAERIASRFDAVVWLSVSAEGRRKRMLTLTLAAHELFPPTSGTDMAFFATACDGVKYISQRLMKQGRSVLLILDGVEPAGKTRASDVEALNFATLTGMRSDRSRLIATARDWAALPGPQLPASAGADVCGDEEDLQEFQAVPVPCLDASSAESMLNFHAFGATDAAAPAYAPRGACTHLAQRCQGNALALRVLGGALRHCTSREDWDAVLRAMPTGKARVSSFSPAVHACAASISVLPQTLQHCLAAVAAVSGGNVPEAQALHACAGLAPLYTPAAVRATERKLQQLVERGLVCIRRARTRRVYYVHAVVQDATISCRCSFDHAGPFRRSRSLCMNGPAVSAATARLLRAAIVPVEGPGQGGQVMPLPQTQQRIACRDSLAWTVMGRAPPESTQERLRATRGISRSHLGALDRFAGSIELNLSGCPHLVQLPESIAAEDSLCRLDLSGCSHLACLPESLGGCLQALHLDLSRCERLAHLPAGIGGCARLAHLNLHGCHSLERLPDSLGGCSMLLGLDLSDCQKLACLPDSIGSLTSMTHLSLHGCARLQELPAVIGKCARLRFLNLANCSSLEELPWSVGGCRRLEGLSLQFCSRLRQLPPSLATLQHLQQLHMHGCSSEVTRTDQPPLLGLSEAVLCWSAAECPFGHATAEWTHGLSIKILGDAPGEEQGNSGVEGVIKQYLWR